MRRQLLPLLAVLGLLGLLLGTGPARAAEVSGPRVEVFDASGVLDATMLGGLRRALDGAPARGVAVFLIQLDSFGGLGIDPAEAQRLVAEAKVPVAVWVGPRAARAAGAATFLLAGADVVATSRQARIGPALPAELGRGRRPAAEATLFGRSRLPAAARNGTIDGAAAERAGLAVYPAESLPDAVQRLNGQRADGRVLDVSGFQVRFLSPGMGDRVRHGLANPTLAYLLLLAAAAMLAFEWFQPGFGVAGVAGVAVALLAVYSLVVLPTNWLALGALLAGLVAFTLDAAAGGLGLGTAAATVLTAVGSWWLFSSPSPLLRVDGRLAVLGVAWCLAYFVVILTVALRSQRQVPLGTEALVGTYGVVRSVLNPGGIVVIDGAMWRARLRDDSLLPAGQRVRVDRVVGGILEVTPEDPSSLRPGKGRGKGRSRHRGEEALPTVRPAGHE